METVRALIINADDLGYDPEVSRGILESIRRGVVSSTTMMVNTPNAQEAAEEAGVLAVGLHFNLARYGPVSPRFPSDFLDRGALSEDLAPQLPPEVVREEALAQLDRIEALLHRPATHVDVHKHLHRHPHVLEGLAAAALERQVPVRSIDAPMRERLSSLQVLTPDHFIGDAQAAPYWTLDRFRDALENLEEGVTELMCHPGYSPSTLRSGYSHQREVELKTFTSEEARALIERGNITIVDYRALTRP
jgi:predicted glycoside hydrolase/deacetylase ChbG (UPF0249 family)